MSNVNSADAADEWFYASNGQQLGPVSMQALKALVGQGQVRADTLVWTAGLPQWVAAGTRAELFPAGASPVAPEAYGVAADPYAYPQQGAYASGYPGGPLSYETMMPKQFEYSGFWLRFCAWFIDAILAYAVGLALNGAVNVGFGFPFMGANPNDMKGNEAAFFAAAGINFVTGVLTSWLYEALMTSSKYQGTLGKLAVGVRVTDMNGQPIGFGRATGRHFAKILSSLIIGIGFIMAAFTERKQGLHDIICSTLVLKKEPS